MPPRAVDAADTVVPWSSVIPVIVAPFEPGGDTLCCVPLGYACASDHSEPAALLCSALSQRSPAPRYRTAYVPAERQRNDCARANVHRSQGNVPPRLLRSLIVVTDERGKLSKQD
jgi:hypothetical protein